MADGHDGSSPPGTGSILIYQYIDEKERQGGTLRMHWLAIFFYDMFGKLGVTV